MRPGFFNRRAIYGRTEKAPALSRLIAYMSHRNTNAQIRYQLPRTDELLVRRFTASEAPNNEESYKTSQAQLLSTVKRGHVGDLDQEHTARGVRLQRNAASCRNAWRKIIQNNSGTFCGTEKEVPAKYIPRSLSLGMDTLFNCWHDLPRRLTFEMSELLSAFAASSNDSYRCDGMTLTCHQ